MAPDRAIREIERAFNQPGDGIGEFNQMIEALTRSAKENGMSRATVVALLLNEISAEAGGGRSDADDRDSFYMYRSIQEMSQAGNALTSRLREREDGR